MKLIPRSGLENLTLARWIVVSLSVLSACVQLTALWSGLDRLDTEWLIVSTFSAVQSYFDLDQYVLYHFALRLLVLALIWFGVIILLAKKPAQTGGLLAALTLAVLPNLVLLGEARPASLFANPWLALAANLRLGFAISGFILLILLYLSFPGWRPVNSWLAWLVAFLAGVFVILVILYEFRILTDVWGAFVLLILCAVVAGAAAQVYRLCRLPTAGERSQVGWVVAAMVFLPVCAVLFSSGAFRGGWGALLNTHVQTLVWVLLPLAMAEAALRRGLWGAAPFSPRTAAGIFLLLLVSAAAVFFSFEQRYRVTHAAPVLVFDAPVVNGTPRPVVISTDMAQDDWLAVLFMLNRPDVAVKAILVDGTGETHCEPGVRNALSMVALAGKSGIPVACGRETPLQGSSAFPEEWRQNVDNLGGFSLPAGQNPPGVLTGSAVEVLIEIVRTSPQPVTILTLGPLTNLAEAVQRETGWQSRVEQVFIMGGALTVPGNVGFAVPENQAAEWNLFVDPLAVQIVFASGLPLTLVPLDATQYVPVTVDFYRSLQANQCTPTARFAGEVIGSLLTGEGLYFWDGLTAALLVDESIGVIQEGRVSVETAPLARQAVTRLDEDGYVMRYASRANNERFAAAFIQAMNAACPAGEVK